MITLSELKELYDFNPETGLFSRIKPVTRAKLGSGGSINDQGYVVLFLKGRSVRGHRAAWLYFYGEWPKSHIDHINGNRSDNRISNLRLASQSQNRQNSKTPKNNTSGYKGVSCDTRHGTWRARIFVNNKDKYLGTFKTKEQASEAYIDAAKKYHGEFARY